MRINFLPIIALSFTLFPIGPMASARTIPVSQQEISVMVSKDQGQLLDWSATNRRIERIFVDNPEQFRESFVFVTDGCSKDKCAASASMINISARAGATGIRRGSIKVVLRDRSARKYVYTVRLIKVTWPVKDGVTSFS
jgi:type IV pilus biogenesis protein CpaD/CtpE